MTWEQISRRPITKDSGGQTNGTNGVLLTIEGLLRNVEWWENGIRFVDKKKRIFGQLRGGWRGWAMGGGVEGQLRGRQRGQKGSHCSGPREFCIGLGWWQRRDGERPQSYLRIRINKSWLPVGCRDEG